MSKPIAVSDKAVLQQYVFANEDRSEIVIADINEIVNAGTPIDSDTGNDLEYLGVVEGTAKVGLYRLYIDFNDASEFLSEAEGRQP